MKTDQETPVPNIKHGNGIIAYIYIPVAILFIILFIVDAIPRYTNTVNYLDDVLEEVDCDVMLRVAGVYLDRDDYEAFLVGVASRSKRTTTIHQVCKYATLDTLCAVLPCISQQRLYGLSREDSATKMQGFYRYIRNNPTVAERDPRAYANLGLDFNWTEYSRMLRLQQELISLCGDRGNAEP